MHCFPLLAVPGLCDQLGTKLEDQTEDAVDDVHDRSCLLCQQTPVQVREEGAEFEKDDKVGLNSTEECDTGSLSA